MNLYLLKNYIRFFYLTYIILFILFIITIQKSYSENKLDTNVTLQQLKMAKGLKISSIVLKGNNRTSDDVIEKNLELKIGDLFDQEKYEKSLQNLKNLLVFSTVNFEIILNKEIKDSVDITIIFDEKWTLLPYFLVGSGGGTSYLLLGLYETNFIGRLYTFNFTYGCKNDNCSSYLYFRNPSVLGSPFNLVTYLTKEHNIFQIYDRNRAVIGAFSNQKEMLNAFTDIKISPTYFLGIGFLYMNNHISDDGISAANSSTNIENKFNLPKSTSSFAFEGRLTLGKIDYDGMKVDGSNFVSILDTTAQANSKPEDNYSSLNNTFLYYNSNLNLGLFTISLPRSSYLALRQNISITSSDVLSQHFFVGGLDKIRGFYDGEYSGKFSWFSNTELRIPSYVNEYLAIQHALFSDAGYAANTFTGMFSTYTGVSIGTGVRILPLKINRVAIRFDYAYTINPIHTFGFNFGILQFF